MIPLIVSCVGIALLIACWVGGVIAWFLAAKYMLKTMASYRPDRQWGKCFPFSLLMPSFFTDEGNRFRAKLLRHLSQGVLFFASGLAIGFGLKAFIEGKVVTQTAALLDAGFPDICTDVACHRIDGLKESACPSSVLHRCVSA